MDEETDLITEAEEEVPGRFHKNTFFLLSSRTACAFCKRVYYKPMSDARTSEEAKPFCKRCGYLGVGDIIPLPPPCYWWEDLEI